MNPGVVSMLRRVLRVGPEPETCPSPSPVVVELRAREEASVRRKQAHRRARDETGNLLEFATLGGPYRRGNT